MAEAPHEDAPAGPPPKPYGSVPCARCGRPVDPLRAARVAIFFDKFRYFCSAECRQGFDPTAGRTPLPIPRRASHHSSPPTPSVATETVAQTPRHATARALEAVASDGLADIGGARGTTLE